jgi:hypothetical protein
MLLVTCPCIRLHTISLEPAQAGNVFGVLCWLLVASGRQMTPLRIPKTDLFFYSLFAFLIIDLQFRRVIHVGVTRFPTDAWTSQQLRGAIGEGLPLSRPDLHFFYNFLEELVLIMAYLYQIQRLPMADEILPSSRSSSITGTEQSM